MPLSLFNLFRLVAYPTRQADQSMGSTYLLRMQMETIMLDQALVDKLSMLKK